MRFREIRVIGAEGEPLGIMQSRQALADAKAMGLDLLMVAPNAVPPVCRIVDYGKYKYETEKREKEGKRKVQDVKGIKLRPNTAANDLNTLLRNARKFLEDGDKVRAVCQFRAREIAHPEIGLRQMATIAERLADLAIVEKAASLDGRQMVMVMIPKPKKSTEKAPDKSSEKSTEGKKKDAENQNSQDGSEAVQDHRNGEDHSEEEREQSHVLPQEQEPTTPS